MKKRRLVQRFAALLLVFMFAYVQTVLINHQSHDSSQHSHSSAKDSDVHSFIVKCIVCDYIFSNRTDTALLNFPLTLTFFTKSVDIHLTESVIHIPSTLPDKHINKGPPFV